MKQARNWIHSRKLRILLLMTLINVYLIFSVILPSLEKAPYYQTKINELVYTQKILATYALHVDYYEQKREHSSQILERFQQEAAKIKNSSFFNQYFDDLKQSHNITVKDQVLTIVHQNPDFHQVDMELTLKGRFEDLTHYLRSFIATNTFLIIVSCQLQSNEPLDTDPPLVLHLKLKCLLPNVT